MLTKFDDKIAKPWWCGSLPKISLQIVVLYMDMKDM
jgi:hypothetical protein